MCGRYTLSTPGPVLAERFHLSNIPDLPPRYNVAPTQPVPVVRLAQGTERELSLLRWGLVPSWADGVSVGNRMINARAETVAEKPSFRSALRQRRCLVLADGFFEWTKAAGGKKQPWLFRLTTGGPFAFAGLWERWTKGEGGPLETCTVLTTEANDVVRPVHERMPVILTEGAEEMWLDPSARPEDLLRLLVPLPAEGMAAGAVLPWVNNPRHDDPRRLELAG